MRYDYDTNYTVRYEAASSSNSSLLQRLTSERSAIAEIANARYSGVTRDLAAFRSSYDLGLRYATSIVQLTGSIRRDSSLIDGEQIDTAAFGAAFAVGRDWIISPLIGYSRPDAESNIIFGQLVLTYAW
jgi:hypothetical protein